MSEKEGEREKMRTEKGLVLAIFHIVFSGPLEKKIKAKSSQKLLMTYPVAILTFLPCLLTQTFILISNVLSTKDYIS